MKKLGLSICMVLFGMASLVQAERSRKEVTFAREGDEK